MIIETLIILISIIFSTLITYFFIPAGHGYHYFAPILLLIAGYIIGVALIWCLLSLFAVFYDKKKIYEKPSKWANYWLTESISYIVRHSGAKIKIIENKPLPKERFLLIANHRSKFDPMIFTAIYGHRDLAFITKPTNFKIPIGGHFMAGACYLSIDRYDKLKSLEVMKRASDLISNDLTSVGVFPEGTRSETNEMGPFHEGVFSIAIKSKCPIVVTSFMGTENIKKNFPKRRTLVTLKIIDVLYPEDYEGKIAVKLSEQCFNLIHDSLEDLN